MVTKRIGFACKWIDHAGQVDGIKPTDACKELNTGATTVRWLREHPTEAEQRLWDLMERNITATYKLVAKVGTLEQDLRMVRLSSDILPVYTEPTWRGWWQRPDVRNFCEREFAKIGDLARSLDVRLSFHPGQFTVLASDNPGIVERSIEEFEYHADMARWMGYGKSFQDFKINVHIAGRQGPQGVLNAYEKLSPEARNCITIENEENAWGLDDCLTLSHTIPIVLDIHHHWVREGEYLSSSDDRVKKVIESWRGVRPTMHYSVSREDVLVDHCTETAPDYKALLESGYKKAKLRAHSNFYWNKPVNEWALSFRDNFDIMCESKAKNIASRALYQEALSLG